MKWMVQAYSVPALSSSSNLMLPCQERPKGGFCFRYFLHAKAYLSNFDLKVRCMCVLGVVILHFPIDNPASTVILHDMKI